MTQSDQQHSAPRQHNGTPIPLPEVPKGVRVIRDVSFGPHERQAYDVYIPEGATGPLPVVVFFHPGAWSRRDKQAVRLMFALEQGFALVSIGYRLAQHAQFPAQVQDANDGIRHLIEHAKEYQIDVDRMVLTGTSAGAHLASLACLATSEADFHPVPELKPRGVVGIYGAYNLADMIADQDAMEIDHTSIDSPLGKMFGEPPAQRPDLLKKISPSSYVRSGLPPMLLMHGHEDIVLPWRQTTNFAELLIDAGTEVTVKVVPVWVTVQKPLGPLLYQMKLSLLLSE
ncbi:alpha/beta hydrolase [Marinomonas rhodophyticola]|uniref:Alpha/beta hydrolase n=1 Tax=Marinomonas rhodophyticola TaxID=2992803 RepID=A0ABT3KJ62_9GAMM|nr:alpha/beta hydrolase [Marinomonas sp. KJ51-3]MCW4630580.1 alpha/beta hydrolase [Marinomonas sp. KJ51-3]